MTNDETNLNDETRNSIVSATLGVRHSCLVIPSSFDIRALALRGFAQSIDVDLVHLHHGVHDALGFGFIRIAKHVAENDRVHLPRETEFVFEPTARSGRSAVGGKFLPEIIDLILGLAVDRERYRFGELELPRTLSGLSATTSTLSSVNSTVITLSCGRGPSSP